MPKRVLLTSHGITGVTGFANQLYLQARALVEDGHEVLVLHRDYRGEPIVFPPDCNAVTAGGRPLNGMTFLPAGAHQWAEDIMPYYINRYKVDVVHTLGDIWCYHYIAGIQKHHPWYWLFHTVNDTEGWVGFWDFGFLNSDISVVPSLSTYEITQKRGLKWCRYIPHGIDTKTFVPSTDDEKRIFRKEIGIPEDAFVIGMVAHNQLRKAINRLIDAFEIFVKGNPANRRSVLVLHCLPRDSQGWDLIQILKDKDLLGNTLFTDKSAKGLADVFVPEKELRKLYCSMDIHALSTGGEGFGIPIIESLACGIPTVMPAYTTGREFLQSQDENGQWRNDVGFAVRWTEYETHHTGGIWCKVDVKELASTFQYIKDNYSEAKVMAMKGRKRVIERYDNEVVKKMWKELYNNFDNIVEERRREVTKDGLRAMRVA